jgi:hypothetical protein
VYIGLARLPSLIDILLSMRLGPGRSGCRGVAENGLHVDSQRLVVPVGLGPVLGRSPLPGLRIPAKMGAMTCPRRVSSAVMARAASGGTSVAAAPAGLNQELFAVLLGLEWANACSVMHVPSVVPR